MGIRRASVVIAIASALTLSGMGAVPASAAELATIRGIVSAPGGGVPDGTVRVILSATQYDPPGFTYTVDIDPATGSYEIIAPERAYYLRFQYLGDGNILETIRASGAHASGLILERPEVVLTAGTPLIVDRSLRAGASVSGIVTGAGGAAVEAMTVGSAGGVVSHGRSTFDAATGVYVVDRLAPGVASLKFSTPGKRWRQASQALDGPLAEGENRTGVNLTLQPTTSIEGTLHYRGGVIPAVGVSVSLLRYLSGYTGQHEAVATTAADGSYRFSGLAAGTYRVCVYEGSRPVPNTFTHCWGDLPPHEAPGVTVAQHQVVTGIDLELDPAGSIAGRVLARSDATADAVPLETARVTVYRFVDGRYYEEKSSGVDTPDATFAIGPLPPGQYRVRFSDASLAFGAEYWDRQRYFAWADDIEVVTGEMVRMPDVVLEPRTVDVARIQGADRFDVGANVAREVYPPGSEPADGVPVVYIANGLNFPDALTAGPAAAIQGGVVLLVRPTQIPSSVVAELERLRPQRIVVAGGPASVSATVFAQLHDYVSSPADVVRAGGADRYGASRAIVRDAFAAIGARMAIIATGANFPDALTAGPAAASQAGPVILVDGAGLSIDESTRQLITDLGIEHVYIAGGTGSVSPWVENSLKVLLGDENVVRFAGADRFDVGVLLSQTFFAEVDFAFVATGFNFPDALTGGALAVAYGGPLLLSRTECVPSAVALDIAEVGANSVVLLGGPGSLGPAVEQLQVCAY